MLIVIGIVFFALFFKMEILVFTLFLFYLFIYLIFILLFFGCVGSLLCTWDLSLQRAGFSLVVAGGL